MRRELKVFGEERAAERRSYRPGLAKLDEPSAASAGHNIDELRAALMLPKQAKPEALGRILLSTALGLVGDHPSQGRFRDFLIGVLSRKAG